MTKARVIAATSICLFWAAALPVYAQHEGEGGKQPEKQSAPQARPQQARPQEARPAPARPQPAPHQQAQRQQPAPGQSRPAETRSAPAHAAAPAQNAQKSQPRRAEQATARPAAPAQQQHPAQQARQQTPAQAQPQRTRQQAQTWQQQRGWQRPGAWQGRATWQLDVSQHWSSDHRTWAQRGGYGGYLIPLATFNLSFGSRHFFRLGAMPGMYDGYPRFSDGGFSFLIVDPWPSDWGANWYSADDVYVDYNDGYYLCNRSFPQERLAIAIAL